MTGAERVETLTPAHVRGVFQTLQNLRTKKKGHLYVDMAHIYIKVAIVFALHIMTCPGPKGSKP